MVQALNLLTNRVARLRQAVYVQPLCAELNSPKKLASSLPSEQSWNMAGATILYADDDPNDIFFAERAFAKAGMEVTLRAVESGQAAVDYLSKVLKPGAGGNNGLPRLVLLDIKMPGLDGFEVLKWIRSRRELKFLPVVMLSSSTLQSDKDKAWSLGANEYLSKQTLYPELPDLVKPWL